MSQINLKEVFHNTAFSVQLPYIAGHYLYIIQNYAKSTESLDHFTSKTTQPKIENYTFPHPIWTNEELNEVEVNSQTLPKTM